MDHVLIQEVWTVAVLLLFVGIVVWAWSGKRKQRFDKAANIPFEDDDEMVPADKHPKEKSHG
ncbi:MAG: cbb3-type cytochrome c oxidase subunit 3 [Gammaproteobacteria bacterium]|jgi:cytochrome c oxidase cbb3-type subunit 4